MSSISEEVNINMLPLVFHLKQITNTCALNLIFPPFILITKHVINMFA